MSELEHKVRKAAFTYVCHVKADELQIQFDELWLAICPKEPVPQVPDWPPDLSRNLLLAMRQQNESIDALCAKYEID